MTEKQLPSGQHQQGNGRLFIFLAALMWSSSGFFAKSPLFDTWDVAIRGPLLAFWRALFASLVLLPMVRRVEWSWKMAPMVLAFAAMNYTYLSAMAYSTAANAIWLQSTSPIWVFIVGVFIFKEHAHAGDWMSLAFGVAGVGLILAFEINGASPRGAMFGLLSGATLAGIVLSLRQLREYDSAWLVALNHIVTTIILTPLLIEYAIWPTAGQLTLLVFFGVFQMGLPYYFFARGLRTTSGHEASAIILVEPVLVPVWVFLAWRHSPNYTPPQWWTLCGGGLMLLGLLLRYRRSFRRLFERP